MQITLNDAAAIIGCQPNTLRARLHNQPWLIEVLGGEKFGRMWSFDKEDVEAYAKTKRRCRDCAATKR